MTKTLNGGGGGLKFDNTIADAWQSFVALAVPKNSPKVHKQELELAFHSGARAVLSMLRDMAKDDKAIEDDEGMAVVEGWQAECDTLKDNYLSKREASQK